MTPFFISTKIYSGENCTDKLTEFSNPFVVADPFFAKHPILKKLNITTLFTSFPADPDLESVAKGVAEFSKKEHKSLIAIGGGSAMDTAKAILYFGSFSVPFAVIPTTSGSGSEVTSFSVITDKKTNTKHPIVSDKMLPDYAFLEPEVVKTMPKSLVVDTGADVLSHALESIVSLKSSVFSSALAEKAILTVFKQLRKSANGDYSARCDMHYASNLAGIAFNHSNLGLCHAIAHNMGARLKIPHGRANAILLPHIVTLNSTSESAMKIYADLSKKLGNEGSPPILCKKFIRDIKSLFSSLSLPKTLKEAGTNLSLSGMDEIADGALNDGCIKTNPVTPTKEQIINILKEVK